MFISTCVSYQETNNYIFVVKLILCRRYIKVLIIIIPNNYKFTIFSIFMQLGNLEDLLLKKSSKLKNLN